MAFTFIVTFVVGTAVLLSLEVTTANAFPFCNKMIREFAKDGIRLFTNAEAESNPFIIQHKCITNEGRLKNFYSCESGFEALIEYLDYPEILEDYSIILNIDILRSYYGLTEDENILMCIPMTKETEDEVDVEDIEECPSGPYRVNQYTQHTLDSGKLCVTTCQIPVSIQGFSGGTRLRTTVKCCDGEPILDEVTNFYNCHIPSTSPSIASPNTSPTVDLTDTSSSTSTESQTNATHEVAATDEPASNKSAIDGPATDEPPSSDSTSDVELCSSISDPTFKRNYVAAAQSKLCKSKCKYPIGIQGQSAGFRTRKIYKCCNGQAKVVSAVYKLYNCS